MTGVSGPPDGGLGSAVARSVGWVVLERWGSRLLQIAVIALLTRLVAPEAFGIISLATAVSAVLLVFVDSGLSKSLIQVETLKPKDASTAFWTAMALAVVLYAALFAAAPLLSQLLGESELTPVLRVMGAGLIISALSQAPAALLERSFGFKTLSIRQLIAATVGSVAAVPVALLGGGVWALVVQTLTTSVVAFIVLWAATSWRPRFEFSVDSLRRLWRVGLSVMGTELLDAVQGNVDKLVIGFAFSAETLGYYFVAQRVGMILTELVTTVMSRVSLTTFSRVQTEPERLNRIFRQMTFIAGLIAIPVFMIAAAFAPQIVPVVFGDGWEQSIPILWGLAAGWGVGAVMYFDRTVLLASGHAGSAFVVAAVQNAVGVALLFALLPFGLVGVVISRWARIFVWPFRLWILKRAIGLRVTSYVRQVAIVVVAAVPLTVAIAFLQTTEWATSEWALLTFAVPMGAVSVILYGLIVWLIAGVENRETIRSTVRRLPFGRRRGKS